MQMLPGSPYPLGATADGEGTGVNFALFSEHAERVELCLYDGPDGDRELARFDLPEYEHRRSLLASVRDAPPAEVLARLDEGVPKLWLTHRALDVRRRRSELFAPGAEYRPLEAQGPRATNVIAFLRGGGALTVAPRLFVGLGNPPDWADTRLALPAGRRRNALGGSLLEGSVLDLATLLGQFPLALLVAEDA